MHCQYSWKLWAWWLSLWDVKWCAPFSIRQAFDQWHHPPKGKFFNKVWATSFFVIVWSIWKERNGRIFKESKSSIPQVQELILLRLSWWIKGWGDQFPYNTNEVLINPKCLQWTHRPLTVSKTITPYTAELWSPPPVNLMKWMWTPRLAPRWENRQLEVF